MISKGYFVTGTDTGVGKTWFTLALMAHLQQQGHRVLGMKPVASGCEQTDQGLRNEDALLIQQQASVTLPYDTLNPYAFAPAIAPHLAVAQAGVAIELERIKSLADVLQQQTDYLIVEGAGGWLVPLNDHDYIADLATCLQLPVILVVGLRLGCINHALLSAAAIQQSGCVLVGWVANTLDPHMPYLQQNIDSISARLPVPLLGTLPYQQQRDSAQLGQYLSLE